MSLCPFFRASDAWHGSQMRDGPQVRRSQTWHGGNQPLGEAVGHFATMQPVPRQLA